ncbi:hypothetical protein DS745_03150 [Anaerobacillus alkaliphilus]|uniref:Uncharacterized protein n=1 Tax=Anaerobacillus alkaliphilus TaxID=1548597 RepID=A0A4Q0VZ24_9BACI|nr:hypothetical protein [Anaerobacillus alkaliphilus]RXJ04396.1 hypothetical protein DS745_03150 [Anaerobacillus alkaliphilus]
MRLKKLVIMMPLLLLLLGIFYALLYSSNSNRVFSAIDFNNKVYNSTSLKYEDLSFEARTFISVEEFNNWNTWEDVEKSFSKFNNPNVDADFVTHGAYAVTYSYYHKSIVGYKLSYLKFQR